MEFLFDTHLLLRIIEGSDKLPNKVKDILENAYVLESDLVLSNKKEEK